MRKEFSKIYLAGLFLLLIIISVFAALIFEKTTKDNNQKIITLNLDTKVEENLFWIGKLFTKIKWVIRGLKIYLQRD